MTTIAPMRLQGYVDTDYDEAIEYLTANPLKIDDAWSDPRVNRGGSLFAFATRTGQVEGFDTDNLTGCLTQIRTGRGRDRDYQSGFSEAITREIQDDGRLPTRMRDITLKHLRRFAYWQQRFDVLAVETNDGNPNSDV